MTVEERATHAEAEAFASLRADQEFLKGFPHLARIVPSIGEDLAVRLARMIASSRVSTSSSEDK